MFTGLIEEVGEVLLIQRASVNRLEISSKTVSTGVSVGDSVAVNGVCLTVTSYRPGILAFDFVKETASRTTLGDLRIADQVNLESSLKAGESLGGHFVLGHVDSTCTLRSIKNLGESREITFAADAEVLQLVVEKGSVAIDGISLTVADCDDSGFTIAVIPHSLNKTTLKNKMPGDRVNVETDILGKYVYKLVSGNRNKGGVTMDLLRQNGFI